MYQGSSSCVIYNGQMSELFKVKTGVQQGCVMSSFLFIIYKQTGKNNLHQEKQA